MTDRESPSDFTEVFSWGADHCGQLGLGRTSQGKPVHAIPRFCSYNVPIEQVACGRDHAAFITDEKLVYSMGSNADGALGLGDRTILQKSSPALVENLVIFKARSIACGSAHTACVMENGELYTWGRGNDG